MNVKIITGRIYSFLKSEQYNHGNGEKIMLTPPYARALGIDGDSITLRLSGTHGNLRWFISDPWKDEYKVITLGDNCINSAKFKDLKCISNDILIVSDDNARTYGVKRAGKYWGFNIGIVPETVPASKLPTANDNPKEDYGLNSIFWHNENEVILPLLEDNCQTIYLTQKQKDYVDNHADRPCFYIKENDTIYGHGLNDLRFEIIDENRDISDIEDVERL